MKLNYLLTTFLCLTLNLFAQNQTPDLSPIFPGSSLPFTVSIELAEFMLPNGLHSFASAIYKDKWVIIAGRTNGLHGFGPGNNNFPPQQQNTVVYVIDPASGITYTKSLSDPSSGLSQQQIDTLSVTSPQSYQTKKRLYITGGYGVDTATGTFSTKDTLTAIDLKGIIQWVINPQPGETLASHIRQISDPIFQITGGFMDRTLHDRTLLIFGQDFEGFYSDNSNGAYSEQVRRFKIHDNGSKLSISSEKVFPETPDPNYRRRDLNVVPVMHKAFGFPMPGFVAFSGVFTIDTGVWTVPVLIDTKGHPKMADPSNPSTFKQGMNNYVCPTIGMFSDHSENMYVVFFGGISFGFFQNGVFTTDSEIPFINQVTTVQLDKHNKYTQFLMDAQYPVILSTQSNPGNPLLFGAGAGFFPVDDLPTYRNEVIKFDKLEHQPRLIGYIVGGIQSTLPNTNVNADSAASPYIFKVFVDRTN